MGQEGCLVFDAELSLQLGFGQYNSHVRIACVQWQDPCSQCLCAITGSPQVHARQATNDVQQSACFQHAQWDPTSAVSCCRSDTGGTTSPILACVAACLSPFPSLLLLARWLSSGLMLL